MPKFQILTIASRIFECGKIIRGFFQLHVRIRDDECAWLHGGVVFFLKYDIGE